MKVSCDEFLIPTLLLPAAALADTGFDGTWKTNLEPYKATGRPLALLLAGGDYTCSSCNPPYTVKTDGAEHKTLACDNKVVVSQGCRKCERSKAPLSFRRRSFCLR
jgi:hypothetical protein